MPSIQNLSDVEDYGWERKYFGIINDDNIVEQGIEFYFGEIGSFYGLIVG